MGKDTTEETTGEPTFEMTLPMAHSLTGQATVDVAHKTVAHGLSLVQGATIGGSAERYMIAALSNLEDAAANLRAATGEIRGALAGEMVDRLRADLAEGV